MAYVVFESGYSDACGRDWYVEIVSLTAIGNTDKEMLLMAPGVSISYEMDSFNLAKAMIGSALEMTVQFTDNQMTKLNAILDHEEGQVGVILYRGNSAQLNNIEWCGHLLIEQVSIMMAKDMNTTTMTFTDGLGFLKYTDYRSVDGDMYFDRQPLIRQLFRCLHKLPTMNIIKSRFNGSYDFVVDVGLPEPVNPGQFFDYWQEANTEQGVLNNVYVHSQTFGKAKNQTERWRRLFQDSGFVSAYDVVEDIAKTLGCCIAFTNGRWYLWNRSSVTVFNDNKSQLKSFKHTVAFSGGLFIFSDGRPAIASSSNSGQAYQDIYVGEHEYSHVIKGATEGRTIPLAQVLMTHEDVEKDSIISEGTRRRRFGWMDSGAGGFSPHSAFNGYPGNVFAAPANDQYTYGANRNYGYEYVFDFTLYDEVGTEVSPNNRYKNNIATLNPNFQFGFPKRVNSQLFIKGGEPMSFALAGSVNLRERKQNAATLAQIYTHPMGSTYILKARIEVEDSDGNAYRLSRTVRVLQPNEKAATDTKFLKPPGAGVGTQEINDNHYHKVYNDMEWVASNESGYSDSWFELMIPHGSSADNTDADFTNEVAVINEQFEGQNSYGGILCDFDEDDNRLEGGSDTTKGNYLKLFFKENIQFEFPENDTVNFVKVKLEWRMSFIDHRGRLWWESGAGTSPTNADWDDPTFPSETSTPNNDVYGWFFYPRNIKLQYAEIKVGQDGKDMDLQTVAQGGPGFETYNMGASRIGSRDELINRQVTGHLIAPYIDNGSVNNQSDDPALAGVGYVNVKWTTSNDEQGADSGRYDSLHQLLVTEHMANFGQQLSTYQGSIKESPTRAANDFPEEILRPFCVFTTKQFRDSVSIDVMITRLKWSMLDGYQFEGVGIGADRYANASISIQELKPVGRGGGRSGRKPDFGSGIYNINGIQRLRNINKNFTIDSGTGEITAIAVKDGSTVFSADSVSQGTTNKFTDADGVQNLGHLSGDGDGLTSITVKLGSTVFNADKVSEGVINKFTTRAGQQKLNQISINAGGTQITGINLEDDSISALKISPTQGRAWATAQQVSDIDNNKGDIDTLQDDVSDINNKVDLISISQQHNLDDTKNRVGNIIIDAQNPTSGLVGFNVKSGSTPLNADQVDQTNTTNKFATQVQLNKVNHLTVSESVNLNTVNTKTGFITVNPSGAGDPGIIELECAGTATIVTLLNVGETSSFKKLTASERTNKLNNISGDSTGISTFTVKSGSTPLNADQVDDASTTKKFTNASGVRKLGYLVEHADEDRIETLKVGTSTSEADVNLFHLHSALLSDNDQCTVSGVYQSACQAIRGAYRLPDPDSDRSGQTGERVVTIDADGDFQEVTDGTKSQVLSTSGAGVLTFTSLTFPVACVSGRVTTAYQNVYYYGSSSFGWNYPIWQSINFNNQTGNPYARNVIDDYAHCGIVCPMGLKNLRVYGTVRNDSGTENIILFLGKVAPPNGSSSSMVLTELGTSTVTVSTTDRHYNVDFSTTGAVAAGDLIFIGIGRASTASGTRYINFSLSIQGTL